MREHSIAKILQINVRVSSSLGHPYIIQLAAIYERMLQARACRRCTALVSAPDAEHRAGLGCHRSRACSRRWPCPLCAWLLSS